MTLPGVPQPVEIEAVYKEKICTRSKFYFSYNQKQYSYKYTRLLKYNDSAYHILLSIIRELFTWKWNWYQVYSQRHVIIWQ